MEPIIYEVIRVDTPEWNPGAGWYVVADSTEYVAYCGPLDYPQSELDAHRVARALNETQ
jgi:hypothetical protein